MAEYAVYKGDQFLAQGKTYELARLLNVRPETIYFWASPACKKRSHGKRKIAIRID